MVSRKGRTMAFGVNLVNNRIRTGELSDNSLQKGIVPDPITRVEVDV